MATDHNFRVKNGLEVGGVLIANSSGQLTVGELYNSGSLRLSTTATGIEIEGPNGDVTIGAQNTSGLHIYTDRARFYFNKRISLIENILTSYDNDLYLQKQGATKLTLTSTGASVTGDLAVSGDLNITGDINSVSVTDLDVVDKTITVGQGQSASNSTGSGLVVSGANANMLWDNSDDRWEFNKDVYTDGAFEVGNIRIYKSGDSNHLHISAPTAIIGPSTTTASNPSLGTSSYRFDGLFSSTGSFSGTLTVAGQSTLARPVLVNGANDNSGKADLSVAVGGSHSQLSLYGGQVQAGALDMNWNAKFFHDSNGGQLAVWDNDLILFTQGSNTGSATARDIIFSPQTSGTAIATERMRIKGSGNVGIGTSSPAANLHIKSIGDVGDALLIIEADADNNVETDNPRLELRQDGNNVAGYLYLEGTGGNSATGTVDNYLVLQNKGNNGQGIHFVTGGLAPAQSGGPTNGSVKMTIKDNGNIGVGIIGPSSLFHIHQTGNGAANSLWIEDDARRIKIGRDQITTHNSSTDAVEGLYIQPDGNTSFASSSGSVTIGHTSPPTGKLYVRNGSTGQTYTNVGGILVDVNGTSNSYYSLRVGSSVGNANFVVTNAANVGIGTASPGYQLDIQGSSATARVKKTANDATMIVESTTAGAWTTYRSPNYYAGALYVINGTEEWAAGLLQGVDRWTVRKGRSGTEFFTITNTGNIGINTGSPDAKFQIEHNGGHTSGNIAISHSMFDLYNPLEANTDEKGSILTFSDNYFDGTNYIRTTRAAIKGGTDTTGNTADGFLAFYTDSASANSATERMRITKDGRVGIGTNNPIQALQAVGSIYANGGNVFVDSGQKFIWGNSQQWIQASNSASMFFATNGQNRLELQTDGDLILSGDIFMGDEHIDFKTNGSSQVPQLRGHRSSVDLDSRNFTTEGGFSYTTFESSTSNKPSHVSNNANGVITLNTHSGSYNHQLAFTNKGNIAQRSRDGGGYTSWYNILTDRAPNNPSITSTTTVNETIEIVFAASTSSDHVTATSYEVWSDGGTGSDYSLIAKIPYNDIASSMSVVDSSFDDSGTIAYRVYAIKNGVYSTASTTTHSFSMPSLDVSNMSVVADTTNYYIQYDMPDSRFLDHVEIYMDAEASSSNLTRTGATLVYSGTSDSYMYNISSSDMEKYHQFWVEVVTV